MRLLAMRPNAALPVDPEAGDGRRRRRRRHLRMAFLILMGAFLAIQLVPYGHDHADPPVTAEPKWDSPQTRALAERACFDCHSNQTRWLWYTNVAPFSWLIQNDVQSGRASLNFSEWNRPQDGAGDVAELIRSGEMPPWYYDLIHSSARLSSAEKAALIRGLQATFIASPPLAGP